MPLDPSQAAPGTSTIAEGGPKAPEYRSIAEFNAAFTERMARAALSRKKNLRGASEQEIVGGIDAMKTAYTNAFAAFWKKQGMEVDEQSAEVAWGKARKAAIDRYAELSQRPEAAEPQSAQPMPPAPSAQAGERAEEPEIPAAVVPEETITAVPVEVPDELRMARWMDWFGHPLDGDTLSRFNQEFGQALGEVLGKLSGEPRQRVAELDAIMEVYEKVLLRMYTNSNPTADERMLREELDRALPSYWKSVLDFAKQFSAAA